MKRELLLLDITEMSGSNVCVAGIDAESGQQNRLADPSPTRAHVRRWELSPGDIIEVDYSLKRRATRPHVEDAEWRFIRKIRHMDVTAIAAQLHNSVFDSVREAFGEPAVRSRNCAWPPGAGDRSLATVRVRYTRVELDPYGKPRIAFKDGSEDYYASVPLQDLRVKMHPYECASCETETRKEFAANAGLIRVGLTRPFPSSSSDPPQCWLQVTNIFARPRTHFV